MHRRVGNRRTLYLVAILALLLAGVGIATVLAAPPSLTGSLSVNTAEVGKTVNQVLTLDGATSGTVKSIQITRPSGWGVPSVGTIKFLDSTGTTTVTVASSSTTGQVTTITITSPPTGLTFDNAADKLEINFSTTAPTTPKACADSEFGVSVSDGSTSATVAADAGGDCGDKLQVRVHHGPVTQFTVDVPASGDFAANVALANENRPGIVITAQDQYGNTADGANGGTAYTGQITVTTSPSVSAPVVVTAAAGQATATIKPTSGGTVKVVATDKTNPAITGQSADVFVASPALSVSSGHGAANEKLTFTGTGNWGPAGWTILENSITIASNATTHPPIVIDSSGGFPATQVTRAVKLPRGQYDVTAQVHNSAGTISQYKKTFVKALTITPDLVQFTPAGGKLTGQAGQNATLKATGLAANVVPAILLRDENGTDFPLSGVPNTTATGDFGGGSVSLTIPGLPEGVYDLVINDGQEWVFDLNLPVTANIELNPTISDGLVRTPPNTTEFDGHAFPANLNAGDVAIAIGGAAVDGDQYLHTDANGEFSGFNNDPTQVLTLTQQLAPGIHDVVVTTPGKAYTFTDAYRVPMLTTTQKGSGVAGQQVTFNGKYFLSNQTVSSVALGSDVGNAFSQESSATIVSGAQADASGVLTLTVTIDNDLPAGKRTVKLVDNQGRTFYFPEAFEVVPTLHNISPAQVVRGTATPLNVSLQLRGLQKGGTVVANSITIGGQPTVHSPGTISNNGQLDITVALQSLPASSRHALVVPVENGPTYTFDGAFGVMDVTVDPATGSGASGTKLTLSGVGFAPNTNIGSNSITLGGVNTTHAAKQTGADGSFSGLQVTLNDNLPAGQHNVVVLGNTFDKEYTVGASAKLDPAYGDGHSEVEGSTYGVGPATTTLSGWGFDASATIAANSIQVGGVPVTHTQVTVASDGTFNVVLTLPKLTPGAKDLSLSTTKGTTTKNYTFPGVFHVGQVTLTPVTRAFNQKFTISGSHLLPNASVNWIHFVHTNGTHYPLSLNGVVETDGSGNLAQTLIELSSGTDLPAGSYALYMELGDGTNTIEYLFPEIYTVGAGAQQVTVSPNRGDGRAGNTVTVSVSNFPANKTIPSNSITVGGQATQHVAFKTGSDGSGSVQVTLPVLTPGLKDVVVDGFTQANAYGVATAEILPNSGHGANEQVVVSGKYFLPNTSYPVQLTGPYNSGSTNITTNAAGDLAGPFSPGLLPTGAYTLSVNSGAFLFPNVYTVTPTATASPSTIDGAANTQISLSGTGFQGGAPVPANSITVDGQTFRGRAVTAQATTHNAFTINSNGSFGPVAVTLPALAPGQYKVTVAGQTVEDVFTVIGPVTGTVSINNGAASTTSRTVTLNLTRSDSVDQFAVSENPADLQPPAANAWKPYPSNDQFTYQLQGGPGTVTVYVRFRNSATGKMSDVVSDDIVLIGDPASIHLSADPESIVADGQSTSTITALVLDAAGQPVPGKAVLFDSSLGTITPSATTDSEGKATATLKAGTVTGDAEVRARVGTLMSDVQIVRFVAGPPAKVEAKAAAAKLPADGVSTTSVVITVRDAFDNPVPNVEVQLSTTLGRIVPDTKATTDENGQVEVFLVAGNQAGTAVITAKAGEAEGSATVELTPVAGGIRLFLPVVGR